MTALLTLDVAAVHREDLPGLLGRLVELEALVRLRLAEAVMPAATPEPRILDATQAAAVAGTSTRWLLTATRGRGFRKDLSRKQPRFDEAGLRRWLVERRS